MNIEVKTYSTIVEVEIESENTKITEDISLYNSKNKTYTADENIAEDLITAAFDIYRFNGVDDVDTLKTIFEAFLNTHEQTEFLEDMNE